MVSRKEVEDRILSIMREEFLRHSDETLEKYKAQIESTVKWYVSTLPRHIAGSEAKDLEQEAKIAFVECLKTWDPRRGALWSYVSMRLKGSMQDYLRKRGSDPVAGLYEWITSAANVYMAFNDKSIVHEEVDKLLHIDSAVKILDDKEKKVVEGYYKHDKTFKDIGKDIGLSESQVSRICKEATTKLRIALRNEEQAETEAEARRQ